MKKFEKSIKQLKNKNIRLFFILFFCDFLIGYTSTSLAFGSSLVITLPDDSIYTTEQSNNKFSDIGVERSSIKKQDDGSYKIFLGLRNNKKTAIRFDDYAFGCLLKSDSREYSLSIEEKPIYDQDCFSGKDSKNCGITLIGRPKETIPSDIQHYSVQVFYRYNKGQQTSNDSVYFRFDVPDFQVSMEQSSLANSEEHILNIKNISPSGKEIAIHSFNLNPRYISLIDSPTEGGAPVRVLLDSSYAMKFKLSNEAPKNGWVERVYVNYVIAGGVIKEAIIPIEFHYDEVVGTWKVVAGICGIAWLGYKLWGWRDHGDDHGPDFDSGDDPDQSRPGNRKGGKRRTVQRRHRITADQRVLIEAGMFLRGGSGL